MFKNTPHYQSFFKTWFITYLFRTPQFQMDIQEPIILSHHNQATRFKGFPTYPNDTRPIETGDHLITLYQDKAFHNMMMMAIYILFIDPSNTPVAEKQNNGKKTTEEEEEYIVRATEETPKNWAKVITDDTNCFAIAEGVVKEKHLSLFKKGIEKHLPDWTLVGGTKFGLYFLVRKKYAEKYVIDNKLSETLKKLKLDSRCLTLTGPTEKVSNIHVPHADPEKSYKKIISVILNDMIDQLNLKSDCILSDRIVLKVTHIVSDKEHLKDGSKRLASVSGITEFTLHYNNKIISHQVLGDFNLELNERQKLDREAFSEIKEKFAFQWGFKTTSKNTKYIAGLFVGGGITLSTDFTAIDEASIIATTLGRTGHGFFAEKIASCWENTLIAREYALHARKITN